MNESTRVEYRALVDAINARELGKEELLCHIDDKYASKKISTQEYFELLNNVEATF